MAGDWTVMEHATVGKSELLSIAQLTGLDRHHCLGLMMHFWSWVENQTDDGLIHAPFFQLPVVIGADITFWRAVVQVGWLILPGGEDAPQMVIPRADHWLTRGAKSRLKQARRQNLLRDRKEARKKSRRKRDTSVTTEQNRTEQSSDPERSELSDLIRAEPSARRKRRPASGSDRNGRSSVFDSLDEAALSDIPRLFAWLKHEQTKAKAPLYEKPTKEHLRDVVAAAAYALDQGEHPFRLFCTMVGRGDFSKIHQRTREASDKRVDEFLKTMNGKVT